MNPLRLLYRSRHILYATTLFDIRSRYVGTIFGLGWAVLYPFLFLGLYAIVYALILRIRLQQYSPIDYVELIFAGLIPFIGFSEALSTSAGSIAGNKQLIKNTMFPIELAPVKAVLTGSLSMAIGLLGLMITLWARGQFHATQVLIVPANSATADVLNRHRLDAGGAQRVSPRYRAGDRHQSCCF